jgi:hypothetical protein
MGGDLIEYGLSLLWPIPPRTWDVAWKASKGAPDCFVSSTNRATTFWFAKERRLKRVVHMLRKDMEEGAVFKVSHMAVARALDRNHPSYP